MIYTNNHLVKWLFELINMPLSHIVTFFIVARAPEVCSLTKFLVSSTALLIVIIMLYNRLLGLFILHNYNFVPFDQYLSTHVPHLPQMI